MDHRELLFAGDTKLAGLGSQTAPKRSFRRCRDVLLAATVLAHLADGSTIRVPLSSVRTFNELRASTRQRVAEMSSLVGKKVSLSRRRTT